MKKFSLMFIGMLCASRLSAQYGPASISDTLVVTGYQVSVFSDSTLFYFAPDGTYQVIAEQGISNTNTGFQTYPTTSGTYSYSTVPDTAPTGYPYPPTGLDGTAVLTNSAGSTQWKFTNPYFFEGVSFGVYRRISLTGAANVSNNSWVTAAHPAISGFVIEGGSGRWVLIRGAGPSLAQFGVANPVAKPTLTLSSQAVVNFAANSGAFSNSTAIAINPWSADPNLVAGMKIVFSLTGAFPFPSGSSDCAALVFLQPGAYTVQAGSQGADGQLLTEVYVLPFGT
ncbi:MAG TPA: hypothetical protein VFE25_02410 [Opitutaceae bacterium]|jgi:hypothetical protein|nr:hypothetical protein [Opitutaceae bacterium]